MFRIATRHHQRHTGAGIWMAASVPSRSSGRLAHLYFPVAILDGMWASYRWFPPAGPVLLGFHWAIPLLIGLLLALATLAIAVPSSRDRSTGVDTIEDKQDDVVAVTVFGVFFCLLIIGLLAVIISSYIIYGFTPRELVDFMSVRGFADLFPCWTENQIKASRKEGKIPRLDQWGEMLRGNETGLDALMNLAAINSFAIDHKSMDDRVFSLLEETS